MPSHIRNEVAKLLRRREVLLERMEKLVPNDVAALRAIDAGLQEIGISDDERYLRIRSVKAAILACLKKEKRKMTPAEIADALFRGGFVMHPVRGKRLIYDSVTKGIARGWLQKDADGGISPV